MIEKLENSAEDDFLFKYPFITKTMGNFKLEVSPGQIKPGEI